MSGTTNAARLAIMGLTLAVTASGLTLFGIGSAFWGLLAGLVAVGLDALAKRMRR